jgi:fucose permease
VSIPRRTAAVAMGSFVLLGLPDGTLGVAWPSMRTSFGLPLAALGGLLAPVTAAYLVAGATSGHLIARIGMPRVLIGSLSLFVIGLSLIAASPVWWFLPLGTSVVGLGAGALDAAVNALAATRGAQRLLGLLHGAYSAGGALGPLLVVSAVTLGLTWRGAYGVLAGLAVILTLATWLVGSWQLPASSRPVEGPGVITVAERSPAPGHSGAWRSISRSEWALLLVALCAFFLYTGTEVAAGQWTFTFLTTGQHIDIRLAAAAVSGFWWGQTLVRTASGFIAVRLGPDRLIDVSLGAALVAAAVLWLAPSEALKLIALAVFGGGLGPLFPTLISLTPSRFGSRAVQVVGYQVGAAAIGGTVLTGLAGIVFQQWGLGLLPPLLVGGVTATLLLDHTGRWLVRRPVSTQREAGVTEQDDR